MFRKLVYSIIIVFLLILTTSTGIFLWTSKKIDSFMMTPYILDAEEMEIRIPLGSNLKEVSEILLANGIIKEKFWFKLCGQIYEYDRQIQAGRYQLSGSMSPMEIYEILIHGRVALNSITFPEGITIKEIAQIWETNGYGKKENFLKEVSQFNSASLKKPPTGWEGYLFPDTYMFPENTGNKTMIESMISRFQDIVQPSWLNNAKSMGYNLHEVITLASLIEKETCIPEERQVISSVFHNRLKRSMLLQCDPTVIYAMGENYEGRLLKRHLKIDHPYNTYINPGLPPGPIASPGEKSIYAACFPDTTKYLYFVVNPDGGHYFSRNLVEHNNAVRRYRRFRAGQL